MQIKCQLGGYTYPYNPVEDVNPLVRAVSLTDTLSGRYVTDWGSQPSRRDVSQSWPTMDAAFFQALTSLAAQGGTHSYVDQYGTTFTVVVLPPLYTKLVPGGEAYIGVQLKLHVVSQP